MCENANNVTYIFYCVRDYICILLKSWNLGIPKSNNIMKQPRHLELRPAKSSAFGRRSSAFSGFWENLPLFRYALKTFRFFPISPVIAAPPEVKIKLAPRTTPSSGHLLVLRHCATCCRWKWTLTMTVTCSGQLKTFSTGHDMPPASTTTTDQLLETRVWEWHWTVAASTHPQTRPPVLILEMRKVLFWTGKDLFWTD